LQLLGGSYCIGSGRAPSHQICAQLPIYVIPKLSTLLALNLKIISFLLQSLKRFQFQMFLSGCHRKRPAPKVAALKVWTQHFVT